MIMDLSTNPEDTQVISKTATTTVETTNGAGAVSKDSRIFGVSIMAWVFLMVVMTICICQLWVIPLYDHMAALSLTLCGFYAGSKINK